MTDETGTGRRRQRSGAAVTGLVMVALLGVSGCGMAAEELTEQAVEAAASDDVEVELDADSGSARIEGEDGSMTVGETELPDGFPDDLPLPDDYTVQVSFEDNTTTTVNLATTDDYDSLTDRLRREFTAAGYAVENKMNSQMGDTRSRTLLGTRDGLRVSLSVNQAGTDTMVNYLVEREAE